MVAKIFFGYSFHAVDFYFDIISTFDGIGHFIDIFLVNLEKEMCVCVCVCRSASNRSSYLNRMDLQTGSRVELFMTDMTFEMFRFLMLEKNLLIVKFPITVPTPGFGLFLFLSSHQFRLTRRERKSEELRTTKMRQETLTDSLQANSF